MNYINNDNISTLFGSLGSSNSINYMDYALIKKGSYKKLMTAYYNDVEGTNKTSKTSQSQETSKKDSSDTINSIVNGKLASRTDNTGLTKMKSEADSLSKKAEALSSEELWKQTDGKYDTDKILSAVKDFAQEYNDVISQSSNVKSSQVSSATNWMESMTDTMSKALNKIGITVDSNQKLSIDEGTFKNADMKNVKSLFEGDYSYGGQIKTKAESISSATLMNSALYDSSATATSTLLGMFNTGV